MSLKKVLVEKSIPPPVYKKDIKQAWKFTFARQIRLSVHAKRILALVFAQIQEDEGALRDYYQVSVRDLVEMSETKNKNIHLLMQEAVVELAGTVFEFKDEEGTWYPLQLINTSGTKRTKMAKGVLTIVLNPHLSTMLIGLSHYTKYRLKGFMQLTSWYTMRLYEILSAFKDTGYWEVDVDDFKRHMDLLPRTSGEKPKYKSTNLLIKRTIESPQKELDPTDVAFDFVCKRESTGRGRPKVTGFVFTLKHAVDWENVRARIELAREHPLTAHLVKVMEKNYKFGEKELARFMEMGRGKIGGIVHQIALYKSQGNISDLPRYARTCFENELKKHRAEESLALGHIRELFS